MVGHWSAIGAACGLLSWATEARADAVTATLDWRIPSSHPCLHPDAVKRSVERDLDRPVFRSPEEADVQLVVRLEAETAEAGVLVDLVSTGAVLGTRRLPRAKDDCGKLDRTLALVIDMLVDVPKEELDQQRRDLQPKSVARPSPPPERPPERPPVEPTPPKRAAEREPRVRIAGSGSFQMSAGILPLISLGGGASLVVDAPRLPAIRMTVEVLEGGRVAYEEGVVTFRSVGGGVGAALFRFEPTRRLRIAAWLDARAVDVLANSSGFSGNSGGSRWVVLGGLGVGARYYWLGSLFVTAEVDGVVPFSRPAFFALEADGTDTTLHRVGPVGVDLGVGLGAGFW
ncbi:MAG TPA: hypothetical protein VHE30_07965 [Polyangiaceae bacterium]|nr:hypothetical protein [Polyangiaceae bacterium]